MLCIDIDTVSTRLTWGWARLRLATLAATLWLLMCTATAPSRAGSSIF